LFSVHLTHLGLQMDADGNGHVDKCEFITSVLVQLGYVTREDIQPWLDRFDELDTDNSGTLDLSDLAALMQSSQVEPRPDRVVDACHQVSMQVPLASQS